MSIKAEKLLHLAFITGLVILMAGCRSFGVVHDATDTDYQKRTQYRFVFDNAKERDIYVEETPAVPAIGLTWPEVGVTIYARYLYICEYLDNPAPPLLIVSDNNPEGTWACPGPWSEPIYLEPEE